MFQFKLFIRCYENNYVHQTYVNLPCKVMLGKITDGTVAILFFLVDNQPQDQPSLWNRIVTTSLNHVTDNKNLSWCQLMEVDKTCSVQVMVSARHSTLHKSFLSTQISLIKLTSSTSILYKSKVAAIFECEYFSTSVKLPLSSTVWRVLYWVTTKLQSLQILQGYHLRCGFGFKCFISESRTLDI